MTTDDAGPVIMVVDDVPANVYLLGGILRAQGYQVREYTNGPQALAAAAESLPDLILLDIMMPGMDGYVVCERLKSDAKLASIPVIFLSSLSDTTEKIKAFSLGGVDYITKPFQYREVQARVEIHLKLRRLQVELEEKNRSLTASCDRLRELENLRDGLVQMIIHDLRNPLQGIVGFAEMLDLIERKNLTPKGTSYLRSIARSAEVLIEMITSVLDVSRLESEKMELHLTECDLGSLATDVARRLEALKGERRLVINAPEPPVTVRGDAQLLARLLQNLAGNAIKFTPPSTGFITVSLTRSASGVRITVADNGPGIPPEHREKVFDKFWQADARRRDIKYSTGLGLTFCKLVAEAHGGAIGVESEVGKGSTFWVELPGSGPEVSSRAGDGGEPCFFP